MPADLAGERLRALRALFGLTQVHLAHAVGVTQALISQVENGTRAATEELLTTVAAATDTPRSFFDVVPADLPLDSLRFRRNSTARRTDTRRATALFAEGYRVASELVQSAGYPSPDLPYATRDLDEDAIEDLAGQTREALRLGPDGPVPHVTRALERSGVAVAPIVLPGEASPDTATAAGHFGMSYWAGPGELAFIGYFPGSKPDRDRFTLAHELGHVVLHTHRRRAADPEREANRFASALLMPRDRAEQAMREYLTLPDFARLKAIWGLSIQALIMRGSQLGLVSEDRKRSLFTQLSARGWRRNEPVAVSPEEPLLLWKLLTKRYGSASPAAAADLRIPPVILRSLAPRPTVQRSKPAPERTGSVVSIDARRGNPPEDWPSRRARSSQ